jgi:hypothetical protein
MGILYVGIIIFIFNSYVIKYFPIKETKSFVLI